MIFLKQKFHPLTQFQPSSDKFTTLICLRYMLKFGALSVVDASTSCLRKILY